MSPTPISQQLNVSLKDPMRTSSGYKTIRVTYGGDHPLNISLRRTVRVPDNGSSYNLPPDCGPFPIYSVKQYKDKLPNSMSAKGGMFLPIYEREAMWINFDSLRPFAIKIYAGGVNVISGESYIEGLATMLRRKLRLAEGKSVQEYVVSGSQKWIDGIATADGKVMQLIATPTGSGYSVETQVVGKDSVAGLQFEIMPAKRLMMRITIKSLTGKSILIDNVDGDTTIEDLKDLIRSKEGIPIDQQRLIYGGRQLQDNQKLSECNIAWESILCLVLRLRGGGPGLPDEMSPEEKKMQRETAEKAEEMAVAPGGFINQTIVRDPFPADKWDQENTILFNLQLLNALTFEAILGIKAPETPITAALYKEYGFPFYKMYEELSGIQGTFGGVKSVASIDKKRGKKANAEDAESMKFREVELNTVDEKKPFLPVSEMERALATFNFAQDII
ncbi:related to ubiquitin/ribosomal protein S27a fusion protein [Rhynchosporium secalis]|uniref:Related to ubiquitin/ribosomal protein S27a fusion protein n=1 Tax=Rhynchosporium secalis TaxID=38038 RepID=A0A1E1M084_RHYSE|nr:related to ubiquitin/ribosomal protein S27a fusion protein [Rhynchosporium secalis]